MTLSNLNFMMSLLNFKGLVRTISMGGPLFFKNIINSNRTILVLFWRYPTIDFLPNMDDCYFFKTLQVVSSFSKKSKPFIKSKIPQTLFIDWTVRMIQSIRVWVKYLSILKINEKTWFDFSEYLWVKKSMICEYFWKEIF